MEMAGERKQKSERWADFSTEVKKVSVIAVPMVVVAVLQYMMQMVAVVMVGHVDQLSLSSVAIATSLTNVTGFSLLSGLVGGLETLCGQAFGAKQHDKIGIYTCSAIISLLLVCIPVSISWIFLDKFLILIGQDPMISLEARKYSVYLIPALFGGAITKPLVRSLQSQSLTMPLLLSSMLVLCFHVPLCWAFVFKFKMGSVGAAIAFSLSNWFYLLLMVAYVRFSTMCEDTRVTISIEALFVIKEFFQFAVPSAVMVCLKWWALEVLILVSGLLPNPKLETSVLSICLTISTLHFTIQYGFGAAASTRVSNELGAGNPKAARLAVYTTIFLAITEAIIVSAAVFSCRSFLGNAYSNEMAVVNYVASMAPFISLSLITDSLQAVISGIARGSGWQHIGAYVNLVAFYVFGIPVAVVLGFPLHLKAKGLWIGIMVGSIIQSTSLSLITGVTDWQKQAMKAKERISKITLLVYNNNKGNDVDIREYECA
uniref:protein DETOXIFICATION 14-like n=1 Tax=Erigeron canadensis TaxID=72917 RepID=UPI001CB8BE8E|nr:protein DETOXIFICATION 14-like [Erigeron canadensis]